jgi:hypothetical protein
VFVGQNSALGYDERTPNLYISQRPSFTDPGTVVVLNVSTGTKETINVGVNPQQTRVFYDSGAFTAVTICEGVYGQNDGTLVFIEEDGTTTSLPVGDSPNDMVIDEDRQLIYVVMNGDHAIKLVDLVTRAVVDSWPTGTTGFDGPRSIAITDDYACVTTYSSTVLTFSLDNGSLNNTLSLNAKADPLAVVGEYLWVGQSYVSGTYNPTGDVAVYPLSATSVSESAPVIPRFVVHGSTVSLPFTPASSPLTILDLQGAQVGAHVVDAESNTVYVSGLAAGTYVATKGRKAVLFTVVR